MGAIKISVDTSDVFKNLKLYSETVLKKAQQELVDTAQEIETSAKIEAPVDTGRLQSSITTDKSELKQLSITVGTNVEYASFQENRKQFLFKAVEENRAGFRERIKNILK